MLVGLCQILVFSFVAFSSFIGVNGATFTSISAHVSQWKSVLLFSKLTFSFLCLVCKRSCWFVLNYACEVFAQVQLRCQYMNSFGLSFCNFLYGDFCEYFSCWYDKMPLTIIHSLKTWWLKCYSLFTTCKLMTREAGTCFKFNDIIYLYIELYFDEVYFSQFVWKRSVHISQNSYELICCIFLEI